MEPEFDNTAAKQTSHEKGVSLEIEFALFMKSSLHWDNYSIRSQQKGKSNSGGANADIVAKRSDDRGRKLYNLGVIFSVMGVCLLLIAVLIFIVDDSYSDIIICAVSLGCVLVPGGIFCLWLCKKFYQENAWVECKNLKGKAVYNDMVIFLNQCRDNMACKDKDLKLVEKYFVSASGFVSSALKLAMDNEITCYQYDENKKFEKVKFWK